MNSIKEFEETNRTELLEKFKEYNEEEYIRFVEEEYNSLER